MQLKHRDDECNDCSVQRSHGDRAADREPDHDRVAPPNAIVRRLHPCGQVGRVEPGRQLGQGQRHERERGDVIQLARAHDEDEWARSEQDGRDAGRHVIVRPAQEPM